MTAAEVVATAFTVVLLVVATGGYVAVAWSPFLLLDRVRPLFGVGPADEWWVNYLFDALALGAVHVVGYVVGMSLLGGVVEPAGMIVYTGIGVAVLAMAVAGVILPAAGADWKRGGYVTEITLLGGAVWYAAITVVPPLVLMGLSLARS